MATYTYTGKLTDFGESPFPGSQPNLWVKPIDSAYGPSGPLADKRIPVTVSSDGSFSIVLVASPDTTPNTNYLLRCEWLESGSLIGWTDWKFTALIGGGPIANMPISAATNVWYSTTKPPYDRAGIYWIHPTTGDVREWV